MQELGWLAFLSSVGYSSAVSIQKYYQWEEIRMDEGDVLLVFTSLSYQTTGDCEDTCQMICLPDF
jgi:hypothetical protein